MSYTVLTPGRKTGDRSWEKFQPGWRAQIVTRRTYNRPLDMRDPVEFETWEQTVDREISHQVWLWERAQDRRLNDLQKAEIEELRFFYLARAASSAGRVKWLGGTDMARKVEPCIYNCSALSTETVHDLVDQFWLLLNGVGVGFESVVGTLFGFPTHIPEIEVIGSTRPSSWRGRETNHELWDPVAKVWQIRVGDSARAWAKSAGKLAVGYHRDCKKLVIDTSEVRGPGERLNGYGWICAGDKQLQFALRQIANIRNNAIGRALTQGELHDIINLLGTVLSTRRSAQIGLRRIGDVDWREFATFKTGCDERGEWWRGQSNNTLQSQPGVRPSDAEIDYILEMMFRGKKGEPGIRNLMEAKRRAPWSDLCNACVSADTWISTSEGAVQVRDLIGRPFTAMVGGEEHPSTEKGFFSQGIKQVYTLTTVGGISVKITDDHLIKIIGEGEKFEWVEVKDSQGKLVPIHNQSAARANSPGRDPGTIPGVDVVATIVAEGFEEVFDCTIPGIHEFDGNGLHLHNCAEILLPRSGGVCNLVENVVSHPLCRDFSTLCRLLYLNARANYRQTCTDMRDGMLQAKWHENNQHLRLCGVGLTGIVQRPDLEDWQIEAMRLAARQGADDMADALGLPRSQAVTTIKPSGTLSKALSLAGEEITEGINQPKAMQFINWINADPADPVVEIARAAGIRVRPNPIPGMNSMLMGIPVKYGDGAINVREPATAQLDRYIRWNRLWADHNTSITVDYDAEEEPAIKAKVKEIWDKGFVSVSFLPREEADYAYLPQEPITREEYDSYVATLRPMDLGTSGRMYSEGELEAGCAGGACPIR